MFSEPRPRAAFFDVDNTLIDLKSMFSYQSFYWYHRPEPGVAPAQSFAAFVARLHDHPQRDDRRVVNRVFYESFAGRDCADVRRLGQRWFHEVVAEYGDGLWIAPALALAQRLRDDGYRLVGVSGSCEEIIAPLLDHLEFDHCLATRLEHSDGRFTGRLLPPQMIGTGKAEAIAGFIAEHGMRASDCVACGDHASDADMLKAVGSAYVVPGDPLLEWLAGQFGWQLLPRTPMPANAGTLHV